MSARIFMHLPVSVVMSAAIVSSALSFILGHAERVCVTSRLGLHRDGEVCTEPSTLSGLLVSASIERGKGSPLLGG
jgi:hypothetical protein